MEAIEECMIEGQTNDQNCMIDYPLDVLSAVTQLLADKL